MWIFVFFDLPTKTKQERKKSGNFRRFLLQDGYMMIQLSVYARLCNGHERVRKHIKRLEKNTPQKGSVRCFEITDMQYNRMKLFLGNKMSSEKYNNNQLLLF